ncbi:MAG: SGNH/GDSL hydrolase family protein [Lachnospiraceae bacterium]|nr:SGNH/GDSL hydrolase family protein [Lachnospiraceae bacterium]
MKLTNEQLRSIHCGVLDFAETKDGYLQAFQYTKEQMDYLEKASEFWYERSMASCAKTLEFHTTASRFTFEYNLIWKGSDDSVELAIDGLISQIYYVKDMEDEGILSFELPVGEKQVMVYFPADATIAIRNFEIDGEFTPVEKKEKVLWMGDSITQGYGPLRSGHTYVSVANRILNYDILNQGIGGYVYDKNVLMKMYDYQPDKIIISMGTNQFGTETMQDVEEYYERLKEIYGDTPVLCITPIWRGDVPGGEPTLIRFCQKTKEICEKYSNIIVVDGFKLVPHLSEYFLDDLHPNCLGCEVYGRNLVAEIKRLGF